MLVQGLAWSVVDDADIAELRRRQPGVRVEGVEGAGHSIQGDRPLELAALIDDFVFGGGGALMDKKVWFSRRALKLHAVILIVVPSFLALCVWQVYRATDGNELSWAYVFEWPFFAAYAVYMWWRLLHAAPDGTPAGPDASASSANGSGPGDERPELAGAGRAGRAGGRGGRRPRRLQRLSGAAGRPRPGRRPLTLRGEGSNLQHPAPKADVLPIELPRNGSIAR